MSKEKGKIQDMNKEQDKVPSDTPMFEVGDTPSEAGASGATSILETIAPVKDEPGMKGAMPQAPVAVAEEDDDLTEITEPWLPASLLDVTNKQFGYRYRWINREQVARRQLERYELVREGDPEVAGMNNILMSMKSQDGCIVKQGQYLMRIHEKWANKRDAYFRTKGEEQYAASVKKFEEAVPSGQVFGKITIERGA